MATTATEPKFPLPVLVFAGTCPGEDVMARVRLIEELLLLTCVGAFVAGIAYAGVILLDWG